MSREHHILNLGAGVQSTTLYLMAIEGTVPAIECAIFADTQEEPEPVYRHLEWLRSLGGPPILIRTRARLGDDLMAGLNATGQKFIGIPAFTTDGASHGRMRRQCSMDYKVRVLNRTIRREVLGVKPKQRIPRDVKVHQYFGISWDEKSRASRIWERYHVTGETWTEPHFPLIDRMLTRANCVDWLERRVPHRVPKSACTFCPFHTDAEWQELKDKGGDDWERLVRIDHALRLPGVIRNRKLKQSVYLHSRCKPIDEINFHPHINAKELQLGFGVECEGVCGV